MSCGWQLLALAGCTEDVRLYSDAGMLPPRLDAGAAPTLPAATVDTSPASGMACDSTVQRVLASLRRDTQDACGTLAAETFRYAACACGSLTISAPFTADGLDSSGAPYVPGAPGAALGSNRGFTTNADLELLGSLRVSGPGAVALSGSTAHVRGNVSLSGALVLNRTVARFDRDLSVGGALVVTNSQARVSGTLYEAAGQEVPGDLMAGSVVVREVSVPDPCICSGTLAQRAATLIAPDGDDTVISLAADALNDPRLALSCGRYRVKPEGPIASTRWAVQGASALVVTGDLAVDGRLQVDLGERAELDVFVLGELRLPPGAQIATNRPAGLRFYVEAASDLTLTGGARFAGNLYAPYSTLRITEEQSFAASLVVRALSVNAATTLHYDRAVLQLASDASGCSDAACAVDGECAAPLLCQSGRCVLAAN